MTRANGIADTSDTPLGLFLGPMIEGLERVSETGSLFLTDAEHPLDLPPAAAFASKAAKSSARCQLEFLSLQSRRARAYLDFPRDITTCKSPADFMTLQMAFWRDALDQYADYGRRVLNVASAIADDPVLHPQDPKHGHDYIDFRQPNGAAKELSADSTESPVEPDKIRATRDRARAERRVA